MRVGRWGRVGGLGLSVCMGCVGCGVGVVRRGAGCGAGLVSGSFTVGAGAGYVVRGGGRFGGGCGLGG